MAMDAVPVDQWAYAVMKRLGSEAGAAGHEQACDKETTKRLHGAKRWEHEDGFSFKGQRREGAADGGRKGLRWTLRFTVGAAGTIVTRDGQFDHQFSMRNVR